MSTPNYDKVLSVVVYKNYHKYPYTTVDTKKKIADIKPKKGGYRSYRQPVEVLYY